MPKYKLTDPSTNKVITVNWLSETPPTDEDAEVIFAKARAASQPKENTAMQNVGQELMETGKEMGEDIIQRGPAILNNLKAGLGATLGGVFDPTHDFTKDAGKSYALRFAGESAALGGELFVDAIKGSAKLLTPEEFENIAQRFGEGAKQKVVNMLKTPTGRMALYALQKGGSFYNSFKSKHPDLAEDLEALGKFTTAIPTTKATQEIGRMGKDIIGHPGLAAIDKKIGQTVRDSFIKAKISTGIGKMRKTFGRVEEYYKQAGKSIQGIVESIKRGDLLDSAGKAIDKLPATMEEFNQSIARYKKLLFTKYNKELKDAEAMGSTIPFGREPVVARKNPGEYGYQDLRDIRERNEYGVQHILNFPEAVISNQTIIEKLTMLRDSKFIQTHKPDMVAKINKRIESLSPGDDYKKGYHTLSEAQEAVTNLNAKIDFTKVQFTDAEQSFIDMVVAKEMQNLLDQKIASLPVSKYASLRSLYGSTRAIEEDVNRAALRGFFKGAPDYVDIFSGMALVQAPILQNPGFAIGALTAETIARFKGKMKNPDRIVRVMFDDVEKLMGKKKEYIPKSVVGKALKRRP